MFKTDKYLTLPLCAFFSIVICGVLPYLYSSDHDASDGKRAAEVQSMPYEAPQWSVDAIPAGWRVTVEGGGKGWVQSGEIPADLEYAREEVTGLMHGHGCVLRHVVEDGEARDHVLLQYESGGRKILWSLWRKSRNKTGFSWGESR